MSTKFDDFLEGQLQDPEFSKEYEALQPERAILQAIIDARKKSGLTQMELSERTGIAQGDISKIENGNANPSLRTLQRLASGMGTVLKVEFIPIQSDAADPRPFGLAKDYPLLLDDETFDALDAEIAEEMGA